MLSNAARATGYVVGQVAPLIQDLDGDHLADIRIPEDARVTFRPAMGYVVVDGVIATLAPVTATLDAQGFLYDPLRGGPGVWLPVGVWLVELPGRLGIPRPLIEVTTEHTEATPYQLGSAIPALQLDQPRPALEVPVDAVEGEVLTWGPDGLDWSSPGATGYVELREQTVAPGIQADRGRLFVRDNGAGKSQLVVQLGVGTAQILATEP